MRCPSKPALLDAVHGAAESEGLEVHLRGCGPCRETYDDMMAATEILAQVPYPGETGLCLTNDEFVSYLTRKGADLMSYRAEDHLASCGRCLDDLATIREGMERDGEDYSPRLAERLAGLRPPARRRPSLSRRSRTDRRSFLPWALVAATLLIALVLWIAQTGVSRPRSSTRRPEATAAPQDRPPVDRPQDARHDSIRVYPQPKRADDSPRDVDPPRKEEGPRIVREPKKKTSPPAKEEPKTETRVMPTPVPPVLLARTAGLLYRGGALVHAGTEVAPVDRIRTGNRWNASFAFGSRYAVWMKRGAELRLERISSTDMVVHLESGEAYFEVGKGEGRFLVRTRHADAVVKGTAFQLTVSGKRCGLAVLRGAVAFENAKGTVLVEAGHGSTAESGRMPRRPALFDVAAATAWTREGEIAAKERSGAYLLHVPGSNPKVQGTIVSAPYVPWELDAYHVARRTADRLESGMIVGYRLRSPQERIWINVDRGTERDVAADGSRGKTRECDRAKRLFGDYLLHARAAAGVRGAVPLLVTFREHRLKAGKAQRERDVCEVAWHGFQPRTIRALGRLYESLLAKHNPAYRMPMRFAQIDATYLYAGEKIKLACTEGDAKSKGYMEPKYTRRAVTFFLDRRFGNPASDFDAYAAIFAEMIEFLAAAK